MQAKLVHSIGKNLQILPIEERKAKLEDLLKKPSGVIRYSVSFTKDIEELLSRTRRSGKRSGAWIKLKLHHEQEFVIGGYTEPDGARKHFGALLAGVNEEKRLKFR